MFLNKKIRSYTIIQFAKFFNFLIKIFMFKIGLAKDAECNYEITSEWKRRNIIKIEITV